MNTVALPSPGLSGSVMSAFDAAYQWEVNVPDYNRLMIDKYNGQFNDIFLMFYNIGNRRAVQTPQGWGWEKGLIARSWATSTTVTGASGAAVTLTITAADVDSEGNSYPIVGDLWMHVETGVVGRIDVKSTNTVEIKPRISTENFAVSNGDAFIQVGTAFAEGTGQPVGRQNFWYKYYWYTQIFKHTYEQTGSMLTNRPQWNRIQPAIGSGGTAIDSYWTEGTMDMEYLHFRDWAYTFFFGQVADNLTDIQTTTGLDYEIGQRGYEFGIGTDGLERADLVSLGNVMDKRFSSNVYMCLLNQTDYSSLNSSILTDLANTNIGMSTAQYAAQKYFGGDMARGQALQSTFDWNLVEIDGFKWVLKKNRIYSDPSGAGVSVSGDNYFTSRNYFIPMNKVEYVENGKQAFGDHVEFVYKSMNGYNRLFELTYDGRAADIPIGEMDLKKAYLTAEAGWFFRGLEQFAMTNSSGT
jgi:hypothetical protein